MQSYATRIGILLLCMLCISTISCKKFLASYSQNNSFIESAADLDELLVGDAYMEFNFIPEMLVSMDDDIDLTKPENSASPRLYTGFTYWQAQPRMNTLGQIDNSDPFFNDLYSRIARINTILYNVPLLQQKGEPVKVLTRISGEAHYLRAWYYLCLVNIYGKPYRPATAATDFGVPLKTNPAVKDQFTFRSTTQQVYDQIIADLLEAEKELEGANLSSTVRVNQTAVQALLSRVYLYMEKYEQALQYADLVIGTNRYKVSDLNVHPAGKDFLKRTSPEVIFTMGANRMPTFTGIGTDIFPTPYYRASNELLASYSPQDLRLQVFFQKNSQSIMKIAKKREEYNTAVDDVSDMFLIRVSELFLNKAEALAALDRFEDARNTLQEFRKYRFKPGELTPVNSEGAALINTIRDERRRELCFEIHRWFDLRRYGVNTKYPFGKSIRHLSFRSEGVNFINNGYYELGPYEQDAAAYIVPIANDEIEFNKGQLINEKRPERPLKQ